MRMIPRFGNRYQFKSGQQRILLGSPPPIGVI
jgi:hypothetical protein